MRRQLDTCEAITDLDVKVHGVVFFPQMPVEEFGALTGAGNFNSTEFTCRLSVDLNDSICVFQVSEMLPHRLQDVLWWAEV